MKLGFSSNSRPISLNVLKMAKLATIVNPAYQQYGLT
jgi:hypothetical protein